MTSSRPPHSRPARLPTRGAAILLALGATTAAALPASAGTATPAATVFAAAPTTTAGDRPLTVDVDSLSPAGLTRADTLVVRGRVTNTSRQALDGVQVELRLTRAPFVTRAGVAGWASGDSTVNASRHVPAQASIPGSLAPGRSAAFTLQLPASDLGLGSALTDAGPYGVLVAATDTASGTGHLLGSHRGFLVWYPSSDVEPTRLTLVAPVQAGLAVPDAGTATTDLLRQVEPGGRLDRELTAIADPAVAWALDPALVQALTPGTQPAAGNGSNSTTTTAPPDPMTLVTTRAAAGGKSASQPEITSTLTSSPGSPSSGTSSGTVWDDPNLRTIAATFLDRLTTRARGRDLVSLPWADPDLTALAHGRATGLLNRAGEEGNHALTSAHLTAQSGVVWPFAGVADPATLSFLSTNRRATVLLDSDTEPVGTDVTYTPSAKVTLPGITPRATGLLYDHTLSRELAAAGATNDPLVGQLVLADLAVVTLQRPNDGRWLLAALPRNWDPAHPQSVAGLLSALHTAPWVSLRTLTQLRESPDDTVTRSPEAYPVSAQAGELPRSSVASLATSELRTTRFEPVITDTSVLSSMRTRALSLVGLGWRGLAPEMAQQATNLARVVNTLYGGITVDRGGAVNLWAPSAELPVWVTNALPYSVRITLTLRPQSGRLVAGKPRVLVLDPDSTQRVRISVRGVASGNVNAEARLTTANGVLLSRPTIILVRVHPNWESLGLSVATCVVVLLFVTGLVRTVRRGRTRPRTQGAPDLDELHPEAGLSRASGPRARHASRGGSRRRPGQAVGAAASTPDGTLAAAATASAVASVGAARADRATAAAMARARTGVLTTPAWAPGTAIPQVLPADPDSDLTSGGDGSPLTGQIPIYRPDLAGAGTSGSSGGTGSGQGTPSGSDQDAGSSGVMRSSALMAAGTLVSRILGLLSTVVLASTIGLTGDGPEAFSVANKVPNTVYILLIGGAFNAILVPQIVRASQLPDGGREFVDRLITLALIALTVITAAVTVAAPLFVALFSDNWSAGRFHLGVLFAFWCLPQVFFYGLYTILGQVLNARGRFGAFMWAPAINNVVIIGGMWLFAHTHHAMAYRPHQVPQAQPASWWSPTTAGVLGGTFTLGIAAQALILVPVLRANGYRWRFRWGFRGVGLGSASRMAGWSFANVAVNQMAFVVVSRVMTAAGDHPHAPGVATYDRAFLLYIVPHSLVTVSLVTALFTRMSRAAARGDLEKVQADLSLGLRLTGVVTVLSSVLFVFLGPLVTYTFFWGNPRSATEGVAEGVAGLVVGLAAFSAHYMFQRVFFVFEDARTPFLIQIPVTIVSMIGCVLSLELLSPQHVIAGVGLAISAGNCVGCAISAVVLRRRIGAFGGGRLAGVFARLVPAGLAAGVAGWLVGHLVTGSLGEGRPAALLGLFLGGSVLVVGYFVVLRMLRVSEVAELVDPLLSRLLPGRRR